MEHERSKRYLAESSDEKKLCPLGEDMAICL